MLQRHSGFALHPGVSFCVEDGRFIFLDQVADRYLALADVQHRAFGKISTGTPIDVAEREQLQALVDEGLLIHTAQANVLYPCSQRVPTLAIPPSLACAVPALAQLRFAWQVTLARRRLKRQGLYRTLEALRLLRAARCHGAPPPTSTLREAADLLAVIGRYITRLDQCLPISLGLAHHLLRQGVDCHLIMGIQLGPFRAHCWVQHDDRLVGDDLDMVRSFTPVLVA